MAVWITRSQPGASVEAALFTVHGYDVVSAPLIGVQMLSPWHIRIDDGPPVSEIESGVGPDLVLVLSAHAVDGFVQAGLLAEIENITCVAVGDSTAAALRRHGVEARTPALSSSEGILAMPEVADLAYNSTVWLLSGVGGRDLLRQYLQDERHSRVVKFELYQRCRVAVDPVMVKNCTVATIASLEALHACVDLFSSNSQPAKSLSLIVPSDRIAAAAASLGFAQVHVASGATPQAMLTALQGIAPC